jgi:hypothetical protein
LRLDSRNEYQRHGCYSPPYKTFLFHYVLRSFTFSAAGSTNQGLSWRNPTPAAWYAIHARTCIRYVSTSIATSRSFFVIPQGMTAGSTGPKGPASPLPFS